ncbi:hypothetical protein Ancab_018307 [Ancistrocladus abbreviatus]
MLRLPSNAGPQSPRPSQGRPYASPRGRAGSTGVPENLTPQNRGKLAMAGASKTWCVAKPSTSNVELQNNILYVCTEQGLDCRAIQPGGSCYEPISSINHASVAMNLYYQKYGRQSHTCFFKNSGLAVFTDPSKITN